MLTNYQEILVDDNSEDFIERVMKENLWTRGYTLRVIDEYKKFVFLGSKKSVAPSFEIDQVWHAHMLFSRDYKKMCNQIGSYFHHQPTKKSEVKSTGKDEYIETKLFYRGIFQQDPPKDIWTNWKDSQYIYVDLKDHWIIPAGDWKALIKLFFKYLTN